MQDFSGKKIVLGVCGGIAAYKTAWLVRRLTESGAEVRVVMSASATEFVTPLTFQALSGHSVRTAVFDAEAERAMGHIELARFADYLVIAPASANMLAKMAHGMADDLLSTLCLVAEVPIFVCPAMNRSMWAHPATQTNIELLQKRGVCVVGPEEGSQACGEYGFGRMSEPEDIITALRLQGIEGLLQGKQVMITAGPTREYIDPVRYISNCSSGKMGFALANAAYRAGASVTLISGPTAIDKPAGIKLIQVDDAISMQTAVMDHLEKGMIFIGNAAVSDYRIEDPASQKIKKQDRDSMTLHLVKNADILSSVVDTCKASLVVGFAAETENVSEYAREKLKRKNLDVIIANQVGNGHGFDSEINEVTIITKNSEQSLPAMHKTRLAGEIIRYLSTLR